MREFSTTVMLAALLTGSLLLSACAESRMHLSDDYGAALKQDKAAQIADPDAKYRGDPAGGSNGSRVASAQDRYVNGKVTAPAAARASSVGSSSSNSGPQ
ncbi:MAG TPA: hypothetical protein VG407_18745 [Caulobacteraceae bacterium]|jgi:hypothetical protein|nr:hypothetical protein [Caulobacteraceae bacterium]